MVLQYGTRDIKLSIPIPPNQQTPHKPDELYVVVRGRGILVHDDKRSRFDSGEILFVAAGVEHHYETSAMISLCGAYSTAAVVAKPEHSRQNPATSGWRPPGGELLEEAEKLTGVNTLGLRSVVSSSRWQDGLKDSTGEALTGSGTVVLRSSSTSCESWKRSC